MRTLSLFMATIVLSFASIQLSFSQDTVEKRSIPLEVELGFLRAYPLGNLSPYGLNYISEFQSPITMISTDLMYVINSRNSVGLSILGGSNNYSMSNHNSYSQQQLQYYGLAYAHTLFNDHWGTRFSASLGYVRDDHRYYELESKSSEKAYANGLGFNIGISASLLAKKGVSVGLKASLSYLVLGKWLGDSKHINSDSYLPSFLGESSRNTVLLPQVGVVIMAR